MSQRLFFFTGKGGVGKTSYSLAFAAHLKSQGKRAYYISFGEDPNTSLCTGLRVPYQKFKIEDSIETYIAKKLNSKTIASWLMKTPFVFSLFSIIPGLGQLILLGHIIDMLEEDPELYFIVDSPASGHALTMFESSHNFLSIFKKGVLAEDIQKAHRFLQNSKNMLVNILALPTEMALTEAKELRADLIKLADLPEPKIIINDIYSQSQALQSAKSEQLPSFIKKKVEIEKELLKEGYEEIQKFPHYSTLSIKETVTELTSEMERLV